jgi:hypothetical protein
MLSQYLGESSIFDECGDTREIGVHDSRLSVAFPIAPANASLVTFVLTYAHLPVCSPHESC